MGTHVNECSFVPITRRNAGYGRFQSHRRPSQSQLQGGANWPWRMLTKAADGVQIF